MAFVNCTIIYSSLLYFAYLVIWFVPLAPTKRCHGVFCVCELLFIEVVFLHRIPNTTRETSFSPAKRKVLAAVPCRSIWNHNHRNRYLPKRDCCKRFGESLISVLGSLFVFVCPPMFLEFLASGFLFVDTHLSWSLSVVP